MIEPNQKGKHYMDTFLVCENKDMMYKDLSCKNIITKEIKKAGLNPVGYSSKNFQIGGFTAVWLLEESHISIHTWPEFNAVDVDVYACNYICDNSKKVKDLYYFLKSLFKPKKSKLIVISR